MGFSLYPFTKRPPAVWPMPLPDFALCILFNHPLSPFLLPVLFLIWRSPHFLTHALFLMLLTHFSYFPLWRVFSHLSYPTTSWLFCLVIELMMVFPFPHLNPFILPIPTRGPSLPPPPFPSCIFLPLSILLSAFLLPIIGPSLSSQPNNLHPPHFFSPFLFPQCPSPESGFLSSLNPIFIPCDLDSRLKPLLTIPDS